MPDCSPGRASRWLLLLPRRTVQADCANPRCRLAGARRPCAVVLEGVLACRRAAPSVVVVHVPSATPRSCAWATCSRLLAEHALCAARPCLAVAAQKLHGGAQVSLQGAS